MYWEGGVEGERKIQEAKPIVASKRETNDWRMFSLHALQVQSCISWLLNRITKNKTYNKSKELSHIYKDEDTVDNELLNNNPLFGVILKNNYYVIFQGQDNNNERQRILLLEITIDDEKGFMENGCWFAAILKGKNKIYGFANRDNIEKIVDSHILLHPWMKKKYIYMNPITISSMINGKKEHVKAHSCSTK